MILYAPPNLLSEYHTGKLLRIGTTWTAEILTSSEYHTGKLLSSVINQMEIQKIQSEYHTSKLLRI